MTNDTQPSCPYWVANDYVHDSETKWHCTQIASLETCLARVRAVVDRLDEYTTWDGFVRALRNAMKGG
jgi:hypothetical protein